MKQGRTPPDRVHVVRPPQDDYTPQAKAASAISPSPAAPGRGIELIRMLAQISDKLKRSEAERYELLAELREYRKSLNDLEDKADKTEKAYLSLESKLKNRDGIEGEMSQRQARFERALKEAESKLVQAAAGQALIDKRLSDTEERQVAIVTRIDESVTEQSRLDRQLEKIGQDKTRMLRKVERMEEILTETQDTLKARALVLLTDQSTAAQGSLAQIPAWSEDRLEAGETSVPWWRKSVRMQGVGMAALVVASLLFGWTINQVQQPEMPKIAVLENGGLARINLEENRWEAIGQNPAASIAPAARDDADTDADPTPALPDIAPGSVDLNTDDMEPLSSSDTLIPVNPQTVASNPGLDQSPAAQEVLNTSDEQLLQALEEDPQQLAAKLNEIAPAAQPDMAATEDEAPSRVDTTAIYNPLQRYASTAYRQDPQVASIVAREKGTGTLATRIGSDPALPASFKPLETQALAGVPEAQHDLAAIYTAGRGGVTQNFEKAALWFREAADQGIGNASYNLGVLYHQGLGVERDLDRAMYWYREAAKLGHPEAQYNLGIAHIEGIGTDYNADMAAAFFESSANQGVVEAAYNLGLIHENGLIGKASKQEDALMWYKIAADGGSSDASAALQQLAGTLQIGKEDINKMAERMQSIYTSTHGRRAGAPAKS